MTNLDTFIDTVLAEGRTHYRDFAWRQTTDAYAVLVSEIMLQQTQTIRVERYFDSWMLHFPTVDALAAASLSDVLEEWQGLGYNRRVLALKKTADILSESWAGLVPTDLADLQALPGIGPATAAGVLAFAYDVPAVYLETNVRTVLLHEFYPEEEDVSDRSLRELLTQITLRVEDRGQSARTWNYALLDYGAALKKAHPNPSRRSRHHNKQSAYEGSRRQKRARLLETVLARPGQSTQELAELFSYDEKLTKSILTDLANEGFIQKYEEAWTVESSSYSSCQD